MAIKGGVKEAAKMLMALGPSAQKKLIEEIKLKDPKMAALLEANLVSMEDLQYLTPPMAIIYFLKMDLPD